ncbi:hypothetical protein ACVIHC_002229 [Bradyrhizobium diazoefficiens]
MPSLEYIRAEIDHMRRQIGRQHKEIQSLRRAGISTASAEMLLGRMQAKVEGLCQQRDQLLGEARVKTYASGKRINGTPAHRRM